MLGRSVASLLAISVITTTLPRVALADLTAEDVATAKSALKEGRALRDAGDLQGALTKFKAAYALVPTPITGYEVGSTQEKLGLLIEARDTLVDVVKMPVSAKEVEEHKVARLNAADLEQKIKPRIPSLTVGLKGTVPAGTQVAIDDHEVPLAALGAARKLNPGKHVVRVTVGAKDKTTDVALKEGEARTIEIDLEAFGTSGPIATTNPTSPMDPGASSTPLPEERGTSTWSTQKTVALVVGGAGVVAMVAGTIVGFSAKSKYDDSAPFCQGNICKSEGVSIRDDARATAGVATIVFGVGAAAAVGGIVLFVTAPSGGSDKSVGVVAVPGGIQLAGRF